MRACVREHARAYGVQALPLRMSHLVPCIVELLGAFCFENAHMVSLRTLSGEQQYLAVSGGAGRSTGVANNCQPLAFTLAAQQIGSGEAPLQQET